MVALWRGEKYVQLYITAIRFFLRRCHTYLTDFQLWCYLRPNHLTSSIGDALLRQSDGILLQLFTSDD